MTSCLNAISVNFVKPQSGLDVNLAYIKTMCGNPDDGGLKMMAMSKSCSK